MQIAFVRGAVGVMAFAGLAACDLDPEQDGAGVSASNQAAASVEGTIWAGSPPSVQTSLVRAELKHSAEFLLRGGYLSAGVSLRNSLGGTITLPVDQFYPQSATVEAGYLYLTALASDVDLIRERIYTSQLPVLHVKLPSDATWTEISATMTPISMIGAGPTLCWPNTTKSYSYRVDLTVWLRRLASAPNQVMVQVPWWTGTPIDGSSPWVVGSRPPMLEGASLVVVYRNDAADMHQIVINDGNDVSLGEPLANRIDLYPQATAETLKTTFIGADGQSTPARWAYGPLSMVDGVSTFDGYTTLPWEGLAPHDPLWSGGTLWDNLTGTVPLPSDRDHVTAALGSSYDCVDWVAQVASVRRADASLCDAPLHLGADSNNADQFPSLGCAGEARVPFYIGRLGSVHTEGPKQNAVTSWTCYLKQQNDRRGTEPACDGVDETSMTTAGRSRTYGFWYLSGPLSDECPNHISGKRGCTLPADCAGIPDLVPIYANDERHNGLARFGACQAQMLANQLARYPTLIGHPDLLFADIEHPPPGYQTTWDLCGSRDRNGQTPCADNQAVLYGFLWRAQQLYKIPGVYTRSNFWRSVFEPESEKKFVYSPGIDFVLWTAGDLAYCKSPADALTRFPNASLGGMRSVIWQYQEGSTGCEVDYDVATQDPVTGFTPDRVWQPWQTVFSRAAERELD